MTTAELHGHLQARGVTVTADGDQLQLDGPDAARGPSYAELAREMGIPETQVTNHLAWARREFRRLVLEALEEATGSEEEFRAEARQLLGIDPP